MLTGLTGTKRLMISLSNVKNRIRSKPTIIYKEPWLVFLVPVILIASVIKRLRITVTKVYLTETRLADLLKLDKCQDKSEVIFERISDFERFKDLALKRIHEEPGMKETFLDLIRSRFKRNDFSLVCYDKNMNPLSLVFIGTGVACFTPVGMEMDLPSQTFGMYDVYTFKEHRGLGYYQKLFYHSARLMHGEGFNTMWLWLMPHNSQSVMVHRKLGITTAKKVLTERMVFGIMKRRMIEVTIPLENL